MCSVPRIYVMYICLGISFSPDMDAGLFGVGEGRYFASVAKSAAERERKGML